MKKINHYQVEVTDPADTGIIGSAKKFEVKAFNVIAENDSYIAIDDPYFTSISKDKSFWDSHIDKPSISLYAKDTCWGTRVRYSLYTAKTKRADTIKKEIEAAINQKYGFFAKGFDLSFIADKEGSAA
jgi:hypothetical protein